MSFFKALVTVLKTVNVEFSDVEKIQRDFQAQFGDKGDQFGLEDLKEGESPTAMKQLEAVARMLDCSIRVYAEVSHPNQPTISLAKLQSPTTVINPKGTQLGWARWQSSARDGIEPIQKFAWGTAPTKPATISVEGHLLKELGWAYLLRELVRTKGCLEDAIVLLGERIAQEDEEGTQGDKTARLREILQELEEKARGPAVTGELESSSSLSQHPFYSHVPKEKSFLVETPSKEQSFFEQLMAANATNSVHSMVSVGSLPTLKSSSLEAIENYSKEYFTTIASKSFNSANKSLHPIRGLSNDTYRVMELIWNGTSTTKSLGKFALSDSVEPMLWLKSMQEALRVAQRAPKVGEKLELEKSSNGSPKIDNYVIKLQRHFELHDQLTLEKKLELATKGLKKNFKTLGAFVEDTAIPEEKARCERDGEQFSIETALFIILKEFRSYLGSKQAAEHTDSSSEEECEKKNNKRPRESRSSRAKDNRPNVPKKNSHSRDNSFRDRDNHSRDKDHSRDRNAKTDIARNKGEELGKPAAFKCWICGKEGHRKEECPDFDPDYKSKRTGEKKARFGMIRQAGHNNAISLFCGEFHLLPKDGYRPQITSIKEDLVQFDTGAEDSNYCSEELAKEAEELGFTRIASKHSVKLADGTTNLNLTHEIEVRIVLKFDKIGRADKEMKITCVIIPSLPYKLTIGARDIVSYDLWSDLMVLTSSKRQGFWGAIQVTEAKSAANPKSDTPLEGSSDNKAKSLSAELGNNSGKEGTDAPTPRERASAVAAEEEPPKTTMRKKEGGFQLVNPPGEEDPFEVQEVISDSCGDSQFDKIQWGETKADISKRILQLLKSFEDVFSENVSPTACKLEPYKIILKKGVQFPPKAMLQPVRPQSPANEMFLREKLARWEKLGVIGKAATRYWSQVHVVNKANKSPRLCIDWRALNQLVELFQFPIPDIKRTLPRLRNHLYYGTLDLTDAYTQIMMHRDSIEYTAFRVLDSIYVMYRLGFGHSGAVAHFQKEMVTKVLVGLIGEICYSYLDDIIIWGDSLEEFESNLQRVLGRIRQYGITAKASKLKFGKSINYLGHVIDKMGMAMSNDRKEALSRIQRPTTVRELHVFLGTANFFRDFVKSHSTFTVSLTKKLEKNLRARLEWTAEETENFLKLKEAILKAPTLWWLQEDLTTGISTDASIYCWGSYLWQLDERGEERIILFISGTFSGASLNWPINEKEMYAIVATFEKIKYLVGTTHVLIKTDHKNLAFMSQPSKSQKVERWKLLLTRYSHTFMVVSGEDNVVADGMSRLMGLYLMGSSESKAAILRDFHGGIAGHRGLKATLKKLKSCGHNWQGMEKELKGLLDSCPICQIVKPGGKRGIAQTFELKAQAEMETIAMDTLGPLDEDSQGYSYILGLTDEFSRYTELTATKSTTAAEAAQVMLNYCCTYGIPQYWKSDRGSQFNNQVVSTLTKSLQSTPKLTSVGSSQENGIVERKFRDVRADLGALMREDPGSDWSSKLKIVQRIINSTPNETTKIAPADLRFGKSQSLDINLLIAAPVRAPSDNTTETLQAAQVTRVQATYNKLASTIASHLDRHGASKAEHRKPEPTRYATGSWVFWELPETRKGDPTSTRRLGPYQVIAQEGNTVKITCKEKEKSIPVSACTAFIPGQVAPERLQAENSEAAEPRYFVEAILDHSFEKPGKPKLDNCKLLVKWTGYAEAEWHYLTEVPDLRQTEALVRYVKQHPSINWLVTKTVRPL